MNPSDPIQKILPIESALIALVPEADGLVETFRKRYDPSAVLVFPAHVTILYPFKPPEELTGEVTRVLEELFQTIPNFRVSFLEMRRFPDVLYLAPVPDEPFKTLTETVVKHFPDMQPYGGEVEEVVPHLTIDQISNPKRMEAIAPDDQESIRGLLPIHHRVEAVTLMDNASGSWQVRTNFPLGKAY